MRVQITMERGVPTGLCVGVTVDLPDGQTSTEREMAIRAVATAAMKCWETGAAQAQPPAPTTVPCFRCNGAGRTEVGESFAVCGQCKGTGGMVAR